MPFFSVKRTNVTSKSVVEFASIDVTLVRFTLKKGTGVPENCVITCIKKAE